MDQLPLESSFSFYDIMSNGEIRELWDSDVDTGPMDIKTYDDWCKTEMYKVRPQVILHDRLMSDAVLGRSPVKTEHSYCHNQSHHCRHEMSDVECEEEEDLLPAIAPKAATSGCGRSRSPFSVILVRTEAAQSRGATPQSTTAHKSKKMPLMKKGGKPSTFFIRNNSYSRRKEIDIEEPNMETADSPGLSLPPTPPPSISSDSENGNVSPVHTCSLRRLIVNVPSFRQPVQTTLISSQPKGSTGALLLTDEEKRTLLAEGYPIPSRLPLTKAEEKSLKKVRRKIKNKISAQESRRKKKEYMDSLERKVQILTTENSDCKRKIMSLERDNSNLALQLSKLQAFIAKYNVKKE